MPSGLWELDAIAASLVREEWGRRTFKSVCLFVVWFVTGKEALGRLRVLTLGVVGPAGLGGRGVRMVGPHNGAESGERVGG